MSSASDYRKLEHREHVLRCPGMYIGSTSVEACNAWVLQRGPEAPNDGASGPVGGGGGAEPGSEGQQQQQQQQQRMHYQENLAYSPGLLKIIDEVIVNAIDHSVRTRLRATSDASAGVQLVKQIDVVVSADRRVIEVSNDGDSVPVERMAAEGGAEGLWVPELIFGHLLTSANYDTSEADKIVGGQNGIGAKACNIFSDWFEIEVVDAARGLKYSQRFEDHMSRVLPPTVATVTAGRKKSRTCVRFQPDYARLGLPEGRLSDDMYALVLKRVYDAAAVTPGGVSVTFGGRPVEVKSFERYVDLYLGPPAITGRAYERPADGWEVVAALNAEGAGLQQVSFVNGVATLRGGKHVDHLVSQMCRRLCDLATARQGRGEDLQLRPQFVRDNLLVFVRATVPAPGFDSQSKETLTTVPSKFGARVELSDAFVDRLYRLPGLVDRLTRLSGAAAEKDARKSDGSKRAHVVVPKLDDAEWAGTARSEQCTLILTEGDSAKASAVAGLSVVGRQKYGVFPLRGKIMNVCDLGPDRIASNVEIAAIKKILGLQTGRDYVSTSELRYGRVLLMTDADLDGSHIKGLLMNLFSQQWPSLLRCDGFLCTLLTPIVKVWLSPAQHKAAAAASGGSAASAARSEPIAFHSPVEYEAWKAAGGKSVRSKYYKGLGTSTSEEAREWFRNLRIVSYRWEGDVCAEALSMAFHKKRSDDRKAWLKAYDPARGIAYGACGGSVSFSDFIDSDLVHFSSYDVVRSIPSVVDGLKVSQRKALFGCRKRNLTTGEIRVAQLAAYVAEQACFHHGEASMQGTIVGMAQDFVGSGNNAPLLLPIGQFGTRLCGGSDSASPRYIHTRLTPVAAKLFLKEDDAVLDYLLDDDTPVEPAHYLPVVPLVLINGAQGIGTGYSTSVPSYDPLEVVKGVRAWIRAHGAEPGAEEPGHKPLLAASQAAKLDHPWHRGFRGRFAQGKGGAAGALCSLGSLAPVSGAKVAVTELPIGMWTDDFKAALDALAEANKEIKSVANESSDTSVRFVLTFTSPAMAAVWTSVAPGTTPPVSRLEKELKMVGTRGLATSNMHLLDARGCIKKYDSPWDILADFCPTRLAGYVRRREHLLKRLSAEAGTLRNRVRFVTMFLAGDLRIDGRDDEALDADLEAKGFDRANKDNKENKENKDPAADGGFDYLLSMPMSSLTSRKVEALQAQLEGKTRELDKLVGTSAEDLWIGDLDALEAFFKTMPK